MHAAASSSGIGCNLSYLQHVFGILKLIEILCDLLGLILAGAAPSIEGYTGHKGFFIFVTVLALVVTLVTFITAILNIQSYCIPSQWPLIEIISCFVLALFFFIGSIVIAVVGKYNGVYGGAAFFGFAAFIAYLADGINRVRIRRAGASASTGESYGPSASGPGRLGGT